MNREELKKTIYKYNLDPNKYLIIGGASMVIQGLKKETSDIDIAVSEEYFEYLLENYDCKLEEGKIDIYYIDDIINFGRNYYNLEEKIILDGIPCQNITGLIKLKKELSREKDLKDLHIIYEKININSLVLAYMGDAIYEVYIRKYLVSKNISKVDQLQKEAVKYVSAKKQSQFLNELLDKNFFTEEEKFIILRARNHKGTRHPKNTDILTYKHATALEAIIGYLYLTNEQEKIDRIMKYIVGE